MSKKNPFTKSIIIIGCNRSGTTLLFRNLSSHPACYSLYIESQDIFYKHYPVNDARGDKVTDTPSPGVISDITACFYKKTKNYEYFKDIAILKHIPKKILQRPVCSLYKKRPLRLVEKTPANCFRVPLLVKLFPDAKFIFLVRRGEDVVSSLMEGWKNWSKVEDSKSWSYTKWHYLLPPGWSQMKGKTLQEICAFQWVESNLTAYNDLNKYCKNKFILLRHEDMIKNPQERYEQLRQYCQLPSSAFFNSIISRIKNRIFTTGGSKPRAEKWRDLHFKEIESVKHIIEPVNKKFYGD